MNTSEIPAGLQAGLIALLEKYESSTILAMLKRLGPKSRFGFPTAARSTHTSTSTSLRSTSVPTTTTRKPTTPSNRRLRNAPRPR